MKRCLEKERENTHKARRTRTVCLDRNLDGFVFPLEERLTSRTPRPEGIFVYSTIVVVLRVSVRNYLKWGFQKYNIVTKSIVSNWRENGIESVIGVVACSLDVIPRFGIIVVVVSRSFFCSSRATSCLDREFRGDCETSSSRGSRFRLALEGCDFFADAELDIFVLVVLILVVCGK